MPKNIAPHESDVPVVSSKRGQFWIPGEIVPTDHGTFQRAPMFVAWEAPEKVTQPLPLVLIHGGGGQGTDWTGTPDGRPGWATRFVQAGFAVYVIDRPGHGRSPFHPDVVGTAGGQFPYEGAEGLFFPEAAREAQTQWTYGREKDSYEVGQLISAMGFLPADLAESERMDGDRLGKLLDITGPAVLITHSAGGPAGWLAADARPELVKAIVAVEPIGPAYGEIPGMGRLDWGLTAAPITYTTAFHTGAQVEAADQSTLRIPALSKMPIAVFTGGASGFVGFEPAVVEFLNTVGASAEWIHYPDHGINGNGHGLMFEANSDETVKPVIVWIQAHVS